MDSNVIVQTIMPIFLLMGTGFLSRKLGVLKSGDERVLNAYVYYFALPSLFLVNLAEIELTQEASMVIIAGIVPIFVALTTHLGLYIVFRFSRETLYLLILSTIFGSLAFFGIPFVTFAFPTARAERLATLSAAFIAVVSVTISITILELYKLERSTVREAFKRVGQRFSRNPLIISILLGVLLSVFRLEIPLPISVSLHMLGSSTSTVAIFMLGVFLYGRKYVELSEALKLSLLRILLMPTVALVVTNLLELPSLESSILVLMHGMPVAISMIVLSERYDFYKETIASLILISSLGAALYLNLWLLILRYQW